MNNIFSNEAIADFFQSILRINSIFYLAINDLQERYRRTIIGPMWLSISSLVLITTLYFIFGRFFKVSTENYYSYIAIGILSWNYITISLIDACSIFINANGIIKQIKIPLFTHVFRSILKNFFIFLHSLILFPLIIYFDKVNITVISSLSIIGIFMVMLNLTWMSMLLAIFSARFRDIPLFLQNFLFIFFYVTPLIWSFEALKVSEGSSLILLTKFNPFYNMVVVIRDPILFSTTNIFSLLYLLFMFIFGVIMTIYFFNRYSKRVPYWL